MRRRAIAVLGSALLVVGVVPARAMPILDVAGWENLESESRYYQSRREGIVGNGADSDIIFESRALVTIGTSGSADLSDLKGTADGRSVRWNGLGVHRRSRHSPARRRRADSPATGGTSACSSWGCGHRPFQSIRARKLIRVSRTIKLMVMPISRSQTLSLGVARLLLRQSPSSFSRVVLPPQVLPDGRPF